MYCQIVDVNKEIFTGEVKSLSTASVFGELTILEGHAPLLAQLIPTPVDVVCADDSHKHFYMSGGFIEVQPKSILILADSAEFASNLDSENIEKSKEMALEIMEGKEDAKMDYSAASMQLSMAVAQLRTLQLHRKGR